MPMQRHVQYFPKTTMTLLTGLVIFQSHRVEPCVLRRTTECFYKSLIHSSSSHLPWRVMGTNHELKFPFPTTWGPRQQGWSFPVIRQPFKRKVWALTITVTQPGDFSQTYTFRPTLSANDIFGINEWHGRGTKGANRLPAGGHTPMPKTSTPNEQDWSFPPTYNRLRNNTLLQVIQQMPWTEAILRFNIQEQ